MSSTGTIRRRFQFWPYFPSGTLRRLGRDIPRKTSPELVDDQLYVCIVNNGSV